MAFVPLNVAPLWRPWRQAGVTHLLLDPAALEVLKSCEAPEQASAEAAPASSRMGHSVTQDAPPTRSPSPGRPVTAQTAAQQPHEAPPPPSSSASSPDGAPNFRIALLEPADWPAAWTELLTRCGSPQPRILWTYSGLAEDLGGRPDMLRRHFFVRLFRDLVMPKGSHAFWPLWAPDALEGVVDPCFFFSGVRALNPESIVLMTDEVPPALELPSMRPFLPTIHQGRRYVLLQEPDGLAKSLADATDSTTPRYTRMVSVLKSLHARNSNG